mgnify:CR=1 FL=1
MRADIRQRPDLEVITSHHDDRLATNHDRHEVTRFCNRIGRASEDPIAMPNIGDLDLENGFVTKQVDGQRGAALYSIGHATLDSRATTRSSE